MIVLKRPVITEKTLRLFEEDNKATFEVSLKADKIAAKQAVEDVYEVTVEKVWTHTRLGKVRTNRLTRKKGRNADKKIMIFKLKEGDKIDAFNQ